MGLNPSKVRYKRQVRSINGRKGDVTINANDVGLANVQNYGIASQAEAEEGLVNNKYMTPLRTKQLVDKFAETPAGAQAKANQAEANAKAASVAKTGDTMTGVLSIQRQGDGVELLKFNTERAWSFYQKGTGTEANLELRSATLNKSLLISSANGDPTLEVKVSNTPSSKKVIVYSGLDVNGTITTNGNTVETTAGAQAKANQAEANAKAASVSKTGDTMTGVLTIQRQGDGVELLKFNTERAWSFYQKGTGTEANLELRSATLNKSLLISSANGDPTLEVKVSNTPSSKKVIVYSGLDVNGTITTNGNTVETTAGAQAKADNAETRAKEYFMGAGIGVQAIWYDISLINGVQPYTSQSRPRFCKIGNIVFLIGSVKNITGPITIGYLPEGYRPIVIDHVYIQNTSMLSTTQATFARWVIGTDGAIRIEAVGGGATFQADKWFPINTCFVADLTFG